MTEKARGPHNPPSVRCVRTSHREQTPSGLACTGEGLRGRVRPGPWSQSWAQILAGLHSAHAGPGSSIPGQAAQLSEPVSSPVYSRGNNVISSWGCLED